MAFLLELWKLLTSKETIPQKTEQYHTKYEKLHTIVRSTYSLLRASMVFSFVSYSFYKVILNFKSALSSDKCCRMSMNDSDGVLMTFFFM